MFSEFEEKIHNLIEQDVPLGIDEIKDISSALKYREIYSTDPWSYDEAKGILAYDGTLNGNTTTFTTVPSALTAT